MNDTMTKLASDEANLFQIIFVRGSMLSVCLAIFIWQQDISLDPFAYKSGMLWARVVAEILLAFAFLIALFNMPLANLTAIMQAAPLLLTLALALLGQERVGWRRYLAIFIGFIGVTIIVRPGGEGFNIYSLFGLMAVSLLVVREITTQRVPSEIPSLYIVYLTTLAGTVVNGLLTLVFGWNPISTVTVTYLFGAAFFIFFGFFFSVRAMRIGEASFSAIFRYTILLWAILMGYLFFGDIPDRWTILGCVIIVGAGIYSISRE